MYQISEDFIKFILPDCPRCDFIHNYLNRAGLETPVIQLEGKNHIYVKFPQNQYNSMFKIKTVIAHYDRFSGSPGANDNSAAVFCLMEWAAKLLKQPGFHNIRLIFTDGEELGNDGVASQGAFALAALFRKLGILQEDVYVFDCMGRGEVPVLSETVLPEGTSRNFTARFSSLEARTQSLIQTGGGGKWFTLPCNYSDNASFIANGIPAVAVTMLPSNEVSMVLRGQKPETWKKLHTPQDNLESLTPESFEIFHNILNLLAEQKTLSD